MKKILLIIPILLILIGCTSTNDKIYLSDNYYKDGVYIEINSKDLDKLKDDNYLLYTYNHFCNFTIPCDKIFKEIMDKYKIDVLSMSIDEYKKTSFFNEVRYAPSILIISKGKIIAYLDAESDADYEKYQKAEEFEKWLTSHIYTEKK